LWEWKHFFWGIMHPLNVDPYVHLPAAFCGICWSWFISSKCQTTNQGRKLEMIQIGWSHLKHGPLWISRLDICIIQTKGPEWHKLWNMWYWIIHMEVL
jgi:hypothetical protein